MIREIPFKYDKNKRELIPELSPEYGCLCQYKSFASDPDLTVDWHWHPVFEVDYILEGESLYQSLGKEYLLHKGDAIFFNTSVLHMSRASSNQTRQYILKFTPDYLTGFSGSLFETKYLSPVMDCKGLQSFLIRPDEAKKVDMVARLLHLFQLCEEEPAFYEIRMQMELWEFWILLMEQTEELRASSPGNVLPEHNKIKEMLDFVHSHYQDRIQVGEIAEAGSVSIRECSRCFRKYLRLPPNEYLNYYRLQMAAALLKHEDDPITIISEDCGFSAVSYFTRLFKAEFGCTPREYRKRNHSV